MIRDDLPRPVRFQTGSVPRVDIDQIAEPCIRRLAISYPAEHLFQDYPIERIMEKKYSWRILRLEQTGIALNQLDRMTFCKLLRNNSTLRRAIAASSAEYSIPMIC